MISSLNLKWLYGSSFIFLAILIAGILNEFYWILLLPLVLLIVWMTFYKLDTLMLLTVFLTPLSINLQKTDLGIGVSLPVEPIIFGMMIIFILKLVSEKQFDRRVITHPVSIVILLHLIWMSITAAFSTLPLVSVKSTLARICFVSVYYFLATQLFRNFKNIKKFIWLYSISLLAVIIYTLVRHASELWTEEAAHVVMNPFYNDHTAYAAAISLFIPVLISFISDNKNTTTKRFFSFLVVLIFFTAIVLSYTRAAWVGLVAALVCALGFLFRIKTWVVVSIASVLLIWVIASWTQIIIKLESNTEKSSTDYREHLESISNISTDASNVERVNRWLCALRMFKAKPVFGWGPGTYQFQYAPFQRNDEKSYISTNTGDRGSSHSEYLGPLSEEGFLGAILMMAIGVIVVFKNSQYIIKTKNRSGKIIAIGIILGLTTYWVHGFLNYFLDTDKASVPFWGFIAILTALQVYHDKKPETIDKNSINNT